MNEVKRVLKQNGKVGIVEFTMNSPIGPPVKIRLSESDLLKIFAKNGFTKVSSESVGEFNYMLILKKD